MRAERQSESGQPPLAPGTREIEDAAHELRIGAERAAGEFAAIEIAARKRIDSLSPIGRRSAVSTPIGASERNSSRASKTSATR